MIQARSIFDFGAIANSIHATQINSKAIELALLSANQNLTDRVVEIDAGYDFYILTSAIFDVHNVTLKIDGNLLVSNNLSEWLSLPNLNYSKAALYFSSSSYIGISGNGMIDGQGYNWWWYTILCLCEKRPQ